jgi:hypothetical protein
MKLDSNQIKFEILKWRKILKIEPQWKIKHHVRNRPTEMSVGNMDSMACIEVDLRYFIADIEFNAQEIEEDELQSVILHELLHIILEPISCASGCGLGKKFEEMNSILTESTIEKLMPGYLYLYELAYNKPSKNRSNKSSSQTIKCRKH